jgi:hypothetical protein
MVHRHAGRLAGVSGRYDTPTPLIPTADSMTVQRTRRTSTTPAVRTLPCVHSGAGDSGWPTPIRPSHGLRCQCHADASILAVAADTDGADHLTD